MLKRQHRQHELRLCYTLIIDATTGFHEANSYRKEKSS